MHFCSAEMQDRAGRPCLVGGIILGFTESLLGTLYGGSVASYASFGVVILLLIFRPWGLLGTRE